MKPVIDESVFIAPSAVCRQNISIGEQSSVWYNAVIRADSAPVQIGSRTNIQDGAILHVDPQYPLSLGDDVTVGHGAILHGCTVGDRVLVGMGAIVMNGAVIDDDCIIGAGALIPEGKHIRSGSLVVGVPGKAVRQLTEDEKHSIAENADHYVLKAKEEKQYLSAQKD